ncbi:MAG: hypothetical protein ACREYC_13325 [Gammaproteobacteria bacterium]
MTMARLVPVARQEFGLSVRTAAKCSQRWYRYKGRPPLRTPKPRAAAQAQQEAEALPAEGEGPAG